MNHHWQLILTLLVLVTAFADQHVNSAGLWWDLINALGFGAFACLLFVCLARPGRIAASAHQTLSYLALVLLLMHGLGFLLLDFVTLEYLKLQAPLYMWAAILSCVLLGVVIVVSLPRFKSRLHIDRRGFQVWHKVLAWMVLISAFYHMLGSGFYLWHPGQGLAFALLMLWVLKGSLPLQLTSQTVSKTLLLMFAMSVIFVFGRNGVW